MIVPYGHIVGNSTGGSEEDAPVLCANPALPLVASFGRAMVMLFSDSTLEEVGRFAFDNFSVDSKALACSWRPDGNKFVINSSDEEMTVFDLKKTESSSYSIPLIGFLLPPSTTRIEYQLFPQSSFRSKVGPVQTISSSHKKVFVSGESGRIGVYTWNSRLVSSIEIGLPAVHQLSVHPSEAVLFAHTSTHEVLAVLPAEGGDVQSPWSAARQERLLSDVGCFHANFGSETISTSQQDKVVRCYSYEIKESVQLTASLTIDSGALTEQVGDVTCIQWDALGSLLYVGFSDYRFLVFTSDRELLYSNGKTEIEQAQSAVWSGGFLFLTHRNEIRLIPTVRYPRIAYYEPDSDLTFLARRTVMVFNQTEWIIHRIPDNLLDTQCKVNVGPLRLHALIPAQCHMTSKNHIAMATNNMIYLFTRRDSTWEEISLEAVLDPSAVPVASMQWDILGLAFFQEEFLIVLRDNGEKSEIVLVDISAENMTLDPISVAAMVSYPISEIKMFGRFCCVLGEDKNAYIFEIRETKRGDQLVPHTPVPVPPCFSLLPLVFEEKIYLIVQSINDQILLLDTAKPHEFPILRNVKSAYLVSTEPFLPAPFHLVVLITTTEGSFVWFPLGDPEGQKINEKPIHVSEADRQLLGLYVPEHQFVFSHCVTNPDNQGQLMIDLYTQYRSYFSDIAFVLLESYPHLFRPFVESLLANDEYLSDFLPHCLHSLFLYHYDSIAQLHPTLETLKSLCSEIPEVPLAMIESLRLVDSAHHEMIFHYIGGPASLFLLAKERGDLFAEKICVPLLHCSALDGQFVWRSRFPACQTKLEGSTSIEMYSQKFSFPDVECQSFHAALQVYCHAIETADMETVSETHQFIEKEAIKHRSSESKKSLPDLGGIQEVDQALLNASFQNHDYLRSLVLLSLPLLSVQAIPDVVIGSARDILERIKRSFVVESPAAASVEDEGEEVEGEGEEEVVEAEEKHGTAVLDTYNLQLFYNTLMDHDLTDYALLCAILLKNRQNCLSLKEKHLELFNLLLT